MALTVKNLFVKIENKEVLKGINIKVERGEVVALLGPNGSGKSTLAFSLMGHPAYQVIRQKDEGKRIKAEGRGQKDEGKRIKAEGRGQKDEGISIDGVDVWEKTPDERARLGLFLAVQYPVSIPGVSVREALLASLRAKGETITALELRKKIEKEAKSLSIDNELLKRGLNEGFSGGEKKKMEILQMRILLPKYAVLDETDSGLDIDALKIVATGAAYMAKKKQTGILVITHYQRLLKYLRPDRVVVVSAGKVVAEGGAELVVELEKKGYKQYE